MFNNCLSLTSLYVKDFDTKNVEHMGHMFQNCYNLSSLDLSNFSTEKVTDFDCMFTNDENLLSLDMSSFYTLNSEKFRNLFDGCYNLTVWLNEKNCSNIISSIPEYVHVIYKDNDISSLFE